MPRPELLLVEAAALYRTGHRDGRAAGKRHHRRSWRAAAARSRAAFVRGLIAADGRDAGSLRDALAELDAVAVDPQEGPLATDRDELAGRLALLQGDPAAARAAFLAVADARRAGLDYPGMARALATAGAATEALGSRGEAADLWLRAGRSAHLGGQNGDAALWLTRARDVGVQAGATDITAEATARLATLAAPSGGTPAQPSTVPAGSG